jgi:RNA polymerase sigma factor (sigma-70 family)
MTILSDRITEITPRLTHLVKGIASDQYSQEDLFQAAILGILEKAEKVAGFAEQKNAYLIQYGFWYAQHQIDAGANYQKHITMDLDTEIEADDEEDDFTAYNLLPDPSESIETTIERRESLAKLIAQVKSLSPSHQAIVKMIGEGCSNLEIARRMGVTPGAIVHNKKRIQAELI